jgi:hypothetical protein
MKERGKSEKEGKKVGKNVDEDRSWKVGKWEGERKKQKQEQTKERK